MRSFTTHLFKKQNINYNEEFKIIYQKKNKENRLIIDRSQMDSQVPKAYKKIEQM